MAIWYYITSHGLGHCVRSAAIINRIPREIPVLVRTDVPQSFLAQELTRPVDLRPARFDCGTLQPDGFTVDAGATGRCYAQIHRDNHAVLDEEVEIARQADVRVVATDVASFPLRIARTLNVPGVVVANFTWACIYKEHLADDPKFAGLLREMEAEYALASHCLRMDFSTPMRAIADQEPIGLVCRRGRNIRSRLGERYALDPKVRWVLMYVGQWPTAFDWNALAKIWDARFLVLGNSAPELAPVVRIDPGEFRGEDVVATCDAVVAKPGYGIASDCVAAGTPLLYTSRSGFAEFSHLDAALQRWGKAIRLPADAFFSADLEGQLKRAYELQAKCDFSLDGAERAAGCLVQLWS